MVLSEWQALAATGQAGAQYGMGWFYQFGLGVQRDLKAASDGCRKAAARSVCISRVSLLAPKGKAVVDLAFAVAGSDSGACTESTSVCAARETDIEVSFETAEDPGAPVYPLRLSFTRKMGDRQIKTKLIVVPFFCSANWVYRWPPHPVLRRLKELM